MRRYRTGFPLRFKFAAKRGVRRETGSEGDPMSVASYHLPGKHHIV